MATVYYPQFDCYKIDADGRRVVVASITLTTYNVTTSTSIGTVSVSAAGVVAQGSVTATAGDVIRFSHASYPEIFLLTLASTQAGAYTVENGLAYMMENLGDAVTSTQVDIYALDIDNPDVAPWLIGSGASGTTVEVPYQSTVAKNLRLFPVSSADNLQRAAVNFDSSNYDDVAIAAATQIMDTADDSWESVRRNYGDTAFEAYDTRASRPLFDHFQSRNTTGTSAETLHLFNCAPRTVFPVNGDTIIGEYTGKLAANGNDKFIRLYFAGTAILDTEADFTAALGNGKKWRLHFTITRKSTSVVRYGVDFHVYGLDPMCTEGELTGLDLPDLGGLSAGTAYDLKFEAETGTAAGDITLTLANARLVNAPTANRVTSGAWAYYEADSFNGAGVALPSDGANISTSWQDLSGNGRHMTVSGSPTFETNELNGLGVVRLGADSNDYFTIPDMSALTSGTIFIVQKVTDVTTNAGHKLGSYSGNDSYYPYEPDTPDSIYDAFGSSDRKTCGPAEVTITSWHVTHVQSATNNWNMWQNGMLVHNDTSHTVGFNAAPTIGFNGAAYMKADIAAIYIFSNNMTAANAARQYRYIAQKWGC